MFLFTPNDTIIESSSNLTFAPYNLKYPYLDQHSKAASLVGTFINEDGIETNKDNLWDKIFDFTEREDGEKNMKLLPPESFELINY